MSVHVERDEQAGRSVAPVDGRVAAFAAYRRQVGRVVLTHTEVDGRHDEYADLVAGPG